MTNSYDVAPIISVDTAVDTKMKTESSYKMTHLKAFMLMITRQQDRGEI